MFPILKQFQLGLGLHGFDSRLSDVALIRKAHKVEHPFNSIGLVDYVQAFGSHVESEEKAQIAATAHIVDTWFTYSRIRSGAVVFRRLSGKAVDQLRPVYWS